MQISNLITTFATGMGSNNWGGRRPGSGRKRINSVPFSARVQPVTLAAIKELACGLGLSQGGTLDYIIRERITR